MSDIKHISVHDLEAFIEENPGTVLVDVRHGDYRAQFGTIENDQHIPRTDLPGSEHPEAQKPAAEQLLDILKPGEKIIVYCQVGISSVRAIEHLMESGFASENNLDLYNLEGGYTAYIEHKANAANT